MPSSSDISAKLYKLRDRLRYQHGAEYKQAKREMYDLEEQFAQQVSKESKVPTTDRKIRDERAVRDFAANRDAERGAFRGTPEGRAFRESASERVIRVDPSQVVREDAYDKGGRRKRQQTPAENKASVRAFSEKFAKEQAKREKSSTPYVGRPGTWDIGADEFTPDKPKKGRTIRTEGAVKSPKLGEQVGRATYDPRAALIETYRTTGGISLEAATHRVEMEELSAKWDESRRLAKNARIDANKTDNHKAAKALLDSAARHEKDAEAITQQILTKRGNFEATQGAYEKQRAEEPTVQGAIRVRKPGSIFAAGITTQSGQLISTDPHKEGGESFSSLSKQDHADMVVGLEHNIEKLYEEADHLDTIGLDSTETRDEIKEHESARDAHREAAFGPAKEEPSTQTSIDFAKPAKQHDPTAAVASRIEPTHPLATFAAKPTSTAPIKNVGGMVGAQKFQTIAEGKGRREETKSLQTGAKGGRFYISASGAKIYAKGM